MLQNIYVITVKNPTLNALILSSCIHLGSPKESDIIPSNEFSNNQFENSLTLLPSSLVSINVFKDLFLKSFQDTSLQEIILLKKAGAKVKAFLPFNAAS